MLDAHINWQDAAIREAAFSLYKNKSIQRKPAVAPLVDELLNSNWLIPSSTEDVFTLSARGRASLVELLDLRMPDWRAWQEALEGDQMLLSEIFADRWNYLQDQLRTNLPQVMHRPSLQLSLLADSSTEIPEHLLAELPKLELSQDNYLYLRGNFDLKLVPQRGKTLELKRIWQMLNEAVIPERDVRNFKELEGELPYLVMTIEDKGVFLDLDLPDNLLAVWVNPENLELSGQFLRFLPQFVPHIHFGDLDHQGLVIAERLALYSQRPVKRFIPSFWQDYLDQFAQPTSQENLGKGAAWRGPVLSQPLLQQLMHSKKWLPQAPLVFDARLYDEIRRLVD